MNFGAVTFTDLVSGRHDGGRDLPVCGDARPSTLLRNSRSPARGAEATAAPPGGVFRHPARRALLARRRPRRRLESRRRARLPARTGGRLGKQGGRRDGSSHRRTVGDRGEWFRSARTK